MNILEGLKSNINIFERSFTYLGGPLKKTV